MDGGRGHPRPTVWSPGIVATSDPPTSRACSRCANIRTTRRSTITTTGTVKFFNEQKGFGFITTPDSDDVFVHVSNIVGGGTLTEGQSVEYEVAPGRKGPEAVNVKAV